MTRLQVCGLAMLLVLSVPAAAIKPLPFDNPVREARYEALLHELRCMVCQNESLASSHADLAADMRHEVHRLIVAGKSDAEVKQFLVARYGEFVLYRPPLELKTWLLWFGPALLVVLGLLALSLAVRGRWRRASAGELPSDDRERLQTLLNRHEDP